MRITAKSRPNRQKVALVATVRNAGPLLSSFITYHLALGFDHVILFFDDPLDPSLDDAQNYPGVTTVLNDADLKKRWMRTSLFASSATVRHTLGSEVMSRQMLNAEIAIDLAREKGMDWLLHLDSDELFYTSGQTMAEHFRQLAEQRVCLITYLNLEALPETAEVHDPFKEVTLFKVNPAILEGGSFTESQRELIASVAQLPEQFFLFYLNGKSAVRLRAGVVPTGPHGFMLPEERGWKARFVRRVIRTRPGKLAKLVLPGLIGRIERSLHPCRTRLSKDPLILHYPCCGFENFWTKYTTLGKFSDKWWGHTDIAKHIGTFHLESRDVVAFGDKTCAREFYEQRAVIKDEFQRRRLMEIGLLRRITEPAHLFQRNGPRSGIHLR